MYSAAAGGGLIWLSPDADEVSRRGSIMPVMATHNKGRDITKGSRLSGASVGGAECVQCVGPSLLRVCCSRALLGPLWVAESKNKEKNINS